MDILMQQNYTGVLKSDPENSFVLGFLATIEKALGNYGGFKAVQEINRYQPR